MTEYLCMGCGYDFSSNDPRAPRNCPQCQGTDIEDLNAGTTKHRTFFDANYCSHGIAGGCDVCRNDKED